MVMILTAGGIQLRLPKSTGRFILRHRLLAGVRRPMIQIKIGARNPTRKNQMSGL